LPGLPAGRSGFGATLCAKQAALKQEVVIVGGGFGGLRAVCALKSAPLDVTLIDRRNYRLGKKPRSEGLGDPVVRCAGTDRSH